MNGLKDDSTKEKESSVVKAAALHGKASTMLPRPIGQFTVGLLWWHPSRAAPAAGDATPACLRRARKELGPSRPSPLTNFRQAIKALTGVHPGRQIIWATPSRRGRTC